MGDRLRVGDRVVELVIPWARGDVLAAVHREGEIVGEEAGEQVDPPPGGARRGGPGPVRGVPGLVTSDHGRPGARRASPRRRIPTTGWPRSRPEAGRVGSQTTAGWSTARSARRATRRPGRSWRPWPPPTPSGATRRPPGPPAYRNGRGRLAGPPVRGGGRSRAPEWPPASGPRSSWPPPPSTSVCGPRTATPCSTRGVLPDLRHGSASWPGAGRCRCPSCRTADPTSPPSTRPTPPGPCCCGPTRRPTRPAVLTDLGRAAEWGRTHGVPVFSDECYAEFTWDGPPRTVLAAGHRRRGGGPLAVQAVQPGRGAGRLLRRRPRAGRPTSARSAATPA